MHEQVHYLTDQCGNIVAVQISLELWEKLKPALVQADRANVSSVFRPDALNEFAEFLRYWDFRYPYDPSVHCPHCGTRVSDWRTAENHPFRLANANLGGLLVFHCKACGSTIRQKHFRDHVALESTPGS